MVRRALIRALDPNAYPRRRTRSRRRFVNGLLAVPGDIVAIVFGLIALGRAALAVLRWIVWFLAWLFSPNPVAPPPFGCGRLNSAFGGPVDRKQVADGLRKRRDWQLEWGRVRSQYVKILETLYGDDLWCMICGFRFPKPRGREFHIDHKVPVDVDPLRSFDFTNLQPACTTCNTSKGRRPARVAERRPRELVAAAAKGRRRYLKDHKGIDPIHAILAKHSKAEHKESIFMMVFKSMRSVKSGS